MRGWSGNGARCAALSIVLVAVLWPEAGSTADRVALVVGNGGL